MRAALENGINLIDTAEGYGCGLAEELVGQSLKAIGKRDEAVIVTKVGPVLEEGKSGCDLSFGNIIKRCESSLKRLGTDYIDLYLAHWPDDTTPIAETMKAAGVLLEQGKIRGFGVSNFKTPLLREALQQGGVCANQLPYSLVDRSIDADNRPFCVENHVGIMAYSPLGKGVLSGKYDAQHLPPKDDYRHQRPHFAAENLGRNLALARRLGKLAASISCTPSQLALAWVLAQPGLTVILPGAKSPEQVRDNAVAGTLAIPPEILAELDALSAG